MNIEKVSFIIVNWNAGDVIADCIESVRRTVKLNFEIIVVDNNSSDNSIAMIKDRYPEVILIPQKENLGFSKACNIGASRSTGKYLLFLNPDTVVYEDAVAKMVHFLQVNPSAAIVGPKIVEKDGDVSAICKRKLPTLHQDFLKIFLITRLTDWIKKRLSKQVPLLKRRFDAFYEKTEECEYLSGSCMCMKKDLFESLGGFDESIPMYLDDNDLCKRTIDSGLKNFYIAEAKILHLERHSTKKAENYKAYDILWMQARIFYYKKHFGIAKTALFKLIILLSVPYLLAIDLLCVPYFILFKKMDAHWMTVKKHLKSGMLIFNDRVGLI